MIAEHHYIHTIQILSSSDDDANDDELMIILTNVIAVNVVTFDNISDCSDSTAYCCGSPVGKSSKSPR